MTATPPTTPPAIAPALDLLPEAGGGVGTGGELELELEEVEVEGKLKGVRVSIIGVTGEDTICPLYVRATGLENGLVKQPTLLYPTSVKEKAPQYGR